MTPEQREALAQAHRAAMLAQGKADRMLYSSAYTAADQAASREEADRLELAFYDMLAYLEAGAAVGGGDRLMGEQ